MLCVQDAPRLMDGLHASCSASEIHTLARNTEFSFEAIRDLDHKGHWAEYMQWFLEAPQRLLGLKSQCSRVRFSELLSQSWGCFDPDACKISAGKSKWRPPHITLQWAGCSYGEGVEAKGVVRPHGAQVRRRPRRPGRSVSVQGLSRGSASWMHARHAGSVACACKCGCCRACCAHARQSLRAVRASRKHYGETALAHSLTALYFLAALSRASRDRIAAYGDTPSRCVLEARRR